MRRIAKQVMSMVAAASMLAGAPACTVDRDTQELAPPSENSHPMLDRSEVPGSTQYFAATATRELFARETGHDSIRWIRSYVTSAPSVWDYAKGIPSPAAHSGLILSYQALAENGADFIDTDAGRIELPRTDIDYDEIRFGTRSDGARPAQATTQLPNEMRLAGERAPDGTSRYAASLLRDISNPPVEHISNLVRYDIPAWVTKYSPMAVCGTVFAGRVASAAVLTAAVAAYITNEEAMAASRLAQGTALAASGSNLAAYYLALAALHQGNATSLGTTLPMVALSESMQLGFAASATTLFLTTASNGLGIRKAATVTAIFEWGLLATGLTAWFVAYLNNGWIIAAIAGTGVDTQPIPPDAAGPGLKVAATTAAANYLLWTKASGTCTAVWAVGMTVTDTVMLVARQPAGGGGDVANAANMMALFPEAAVEDDNKVVVDVSGADFKFEDYSSGNADPRDNNHERHGVQICMKSRISSSPDPWGYLTDQWQMANAVVGFRSVASNPQGRPAPMLNTLYLNPHPESHYGPEDVIAHDWFPSSEVGAMGATHELVTSEGYYFVCDGNDDINANGLPDADDGATPQDPDVGCLTYNTNERLIFPMQEMAAQYRCVSLWIDQTRLPTRSEYPGSDQDAAAAVDGAQVSKTIVLWVSKTPDGLDHTQMSFTIKGTLGKPTNSSYPWIVATDQNGNRYWQQNMMPGGGGGGGGGGGEVCGNGFCAGTESCSTCSADCGTCGGGGGGGGGGDGGDTCGNGICGSMESCSTCSADCGTCGGGGTGGGGGGTCGDGVCNMMQLESCFTCALDCGTC